ncbi:hypothetical protein llap_10951 [Limosa lapponica baueri]|uniref:Uncharacterized protein n=1 Tax=Limosa lapponica baueri TaxID=1758121 RepID=A0A2I0TY39_LIMLA|nr:hypothetical protein llap_10951 [Limosa lapponica baueri]
MMRLLFQGDRQLKDTDVCVSHGHGGVPTVMQLVSKYRSPRATCEPLLNVEEESLPDGLEGELYGALRDAYRHNSQCKEQHGKRKCWAEKERDAFLSRQEGLAGGPPLTAVKKPSFLNLNFAEVPMTSY